MSSWFVVDQLVNWLYTFVFFLTTISVTKRLRCKRGALYSKLCHQDVLAGLILLLPALVVDELFNFFLVTPLLILAISLLLWLDALLFVQFRIEINRQSLAWFFSGSKGLLKNSDMLFAALKHYPAAAFVPALLVFFTILSILIGPSGTIICLSAMLLIFLADSNGKLIDALKVLVVMFAVVLHQQTLILSLSFLHHPYFWVAGLVTILVAAYLLSYFTIQIPYLTTPSLVLNLFKSDKFKFSEQHIPEHFQDVVTLAPQKQRKSNLFGQLAGANVILMTMESCGKYLKPFSNQGLTSKMVQWMEPQKCWIGHNHYCLTPNTTVSTAQIYSGAYSNNPYNREDSPFDHFTPQYINVMKAAGYITIFLDSADINLYDYRKLLNRIGFDHIFGTKDLDHLPGKADYRLIHSIDMLKQAINNQPFFLHVINDQTHVPYEVINKEFFNQHGLGNPKEVYLNALQEVDHIFHEFIQRLSAKIDLGNTLLILTGDHGESFGEYGYAFHSNTIIPQQTEVPFMLTHPALPPLEIAGTTSHFDLFPTIFDLLGLQYDFLSFGQSMALPLDRDILFFHSATLKGNTPANFGFRKDGILYWVDRLFNQVNQIDLSTRKIKLLRGNDKAVVETILWMFLKQMKLINIKS